VSLPARGAKLVFGAFLLPEPVKESGALVYREPLRETLVPLAVVVALDLSFCVGIAMASSWLWVAFLLGATFFSFLVLALGVSLFRRPELVFEGPDGRVRIRRPEQPPFDRPVSDFRSVTIETVSSSGDRQAPAACLEALDGSWVPLHVGWTERRGKGEAGARAVAEAVSGHLGLPLEERLDAPEAGDGEQQG
jgi:hypothetical protein